jgi:signal transduction histidine kinase
MQQSHPTMKAALIAGFLALFAVWLTSVYYFTDRLAASQASSAALHQRFARGQELLFTIRTQVLLGSIYIRDALIESNEQRASEARAQLRSLQTQVREELDQYISSVDSAVDPAAWARLERELRDYWDTALVLTSQRPGDTASTTQAVLRTQVIPRRELIIALSNEIRGLMADAFSREQGQLDAIHRQVRRRMWEATAVAVALGVAVAGVATRFVGRLEAMIRRENAEVDRSRRDLQRLSGRLVRAQEDERRNIARELHDEIGQALTAVDVELAVTERFVARDPRAVSALAEARAVTARALHGVRDLSQLLRPAMLDDFGLPDTLRWHLRKFSDRTGIRTELIEDGLTDRLPIDIEVCVYRTVQEALTNVSRHAGAKACRVFVQRLSSSLVVTVEDDGRGFEPRRAVAAGTAPHDGIGLIGIRERVADLGGTSRIESVEGKGTRLTIELPLTMGAAA